MCKLFFNLLIHVKQIKVKVKVFVEYLLKNLKLRVKRDYENYPFHCFLFTFLLLSPKTFFI